MDQQLSTYKSWSFDSLTSPIMFIGPVAVWPDLAKFHHFGKYLKIFGNIFKVYLVLGKVFCSLWPNLYAFGQISLLKMAKYLKRNLVIWSHWPVASSLLTLALVCLWWLAGSQTSRASRGWRSLSCVASSDVAGWWCKLNCRKAQSGKETKESVTFPRIAKIKMFEQCD